MFSVALSFLLQRMISSRQSPKMSAERQGVAFVLLQEEELPIEPAPIDDNPGPNIRPPLPYLLIEVPSSSSSSSSPSQYTRKFIEGFDFPTSSPVMVLNGFWLRLPLSKPPYEDQNS